MHRFLCAFIFVSASLFGDLSYLLSSGEELRIAMVQSAAEIPQVAAEDILVKSFMTAYEDVPLLDLNPDFKSTGDVRRFYQRYFKEEFGHFEHGELLWFQAYIGEKLVGWATYEFESPTIAYMNLLIVHPDQQKKGIGKHLTFSILNFYPEVKEISLLIRKVNSGGMAFYKKLGFVEFNTPRDANFVDMSLLQGLHWQSK